MIKVLGNWQEIGEANEFLSRNALPKHGHNAEKNWGLWEIPFLTRMHTDKRTDAHGFPTSISV